MSCSPAQGGPGTARTDAAQARNHTVEAGVSSSGQRIDNFLLREMKNVPRSRIYRAIRNGEVRVNGSRVKAHCRLSPGDRVRVPPIRPETVPETACPPEWPQAIPVLYEDRELMVVDKPAGLAVHSGTKARFGLIDVLRSQHGSLDYLELVHRLDKDTSGCLMLAKSRAMLLYLHDQLGRQRTLGKRYQALVKGQPESRLDMRFPLLVQGRARPGRKVVVCRDGDRAWSVMVPKAPLGSATLVDIELHTGRMHQARVHCAQAGFPIAGDRRYGDRDFNRCMRQAGLGRLFLHAQSLEIRIPSSLRPLRVCAPMPDSLSRVLDHLDAGQTA